MIGYYPPTDEEAFKEWFRSLVVPDLFYLLEDAEPISPIRGYRVKETYLRHFDQVRNLPKNFVCIGDSLCALNPIFGQGMSTASIQVKTLQACLQSVNGQELEHRYYQQAIEGIKSAWLMCTIEDTRWPGVTYTNLQGIGNLPLAQQYLGQIQQCIAFDRDIEEVFTLVQSLMEPIQALFAPDIVAKVLRYSFSFLQKSDVPKKEAVMVAVS